MDEPRPSPSTSSNGPVSREYGRYTMTTSRYASSTISSPRDAHLDSRRYSCIGENDDANGYDLVQLSSVYSQVQTIHFIKVTRLDRRRESMIISMRSPHVHSPTSHHRVKRSIETLLLLIIVRSLVGPFYSPRKPSGTRHRSDSVPVKVSPACAMDGSRQARRLLPFRIPSRIA